MSSLIPVQCSTKWAKKPPGSWSLYWFLIKVNWWIMNVNIWLAQSVKLVLTLHNISSYLPDDSYSTLFFFHLSTCFFSITTLQWQIILVQGKGTPLTQFIRSVGFFFITCMTPNFMLRLDRILQLNMKQIKFYVYLNCYGMEKERSWTWYVSCQWPGCWEKFKIKASVVQLLSHFQTIFEQLG